MVPSKRTWQPLPDVQNVSFADVSNFHLMMSSIRFECLLNSIPFPLISSHFIPSDFHLISFRCILSRSVSSYSYHSSMHFILWIEFHSVLFDPSPYTRYKKLLHHVWWNMQLKTIIIRNISTGTAGTGMLDTLRYSMSDLKKALLGSMIFLCRHEPPAEPCASAGLHMDTKQQPHSRSIWGCDDGTRNMWKCVESTAWFHCCEVIQHVWTRANEWYRIRYIYVYNLCQDPSDSRNHSV